MATYNPESKSDLRKFYEYIGLTKQEIPDFEEEFDCQDDLWLAELEIIANNKSNKYEFELSSVWPESDPDSDNYNDTSDYWLIEATRRPKTIKKKSK